MTKYFADYFTVSLKKLDLCLHFVTIITLFLAKGNYSLSIHPHSFPTLFFFSEEQTPSLLRQPGAYGKYEIDWKKIW